MVAEVEVVVQPLQSKAEEAVQAQGGVQAEGVPLFRSKAGVAVQAQGEVRPFQSKVEVEAPRVLVVE